MTLTTGVSSAYLSLSNLKTVSEGDSFRAVCTSKVGQFL